MRFYKQLVGGRVAAIGTGIGGIEINEEEYTALRREIEEKAHWVAAVSAGERDIAEVPESWREEIRQRVKAREAAEDTHCSEETLMAMTNEELEQILFTFGISANMNKANMVRIILMAQGGEAL